MNQSKEMAKLAYTALSDKKGEDIQIIDISGVSVLADYFLIVNGNSDSQVNALVDNVEEELHKAGYSLVQREGNASGRWVLLDLVILLYMYLTERTDSSTIWRESGKMDIMCLLKILKHKYVQK
mgnify:CR=1 FL=1